MHLLGVICAAVIGLTVSAQTGVVRAETRLALVIGNADYLNLVKLKNATNDARLVADALKQAGFGVTAVENLDRAGLTKTLEQFGNQANGADWIVIYYAGQGIEIAGADYLIPVDAKLKNVGDVPDQTMSLDRVMAAAEGAHKLRVIIFDANRNDPFAAPAKPAAGATSNRGAAASQLSTVVAFSTSAGGLAAEADAADGAYAVALSKHLIDSGVEVSTMFRRIRDDVISATKAKQVPFLYASLHGDFFFVSAKP